MYTIDSLQINNNYFFQTGDHQYTVFNNLTLEIFCYRGRPEDFPSRIKPTEIVNSAGNTELRNKLKGVLPSVTICISEACNLSCKYCYANGGSYNKEEKITMSLADLVYMFEELLKLYPRGVINYTFFGGEPMLGFKEIEGFVEYVTVNSKSRNLVTPHFAIVTNGTLIDKNAWDIFNKYNFSVTVSLDGPKAINDQMRIFPHSQKSVYDAVKNNLTSFGERNFLLVAEATLGDFYFLNYRPGSAKEYLDSFYSLGFDSAFPFIAETENTDYNNSDFLQGVVCFYHDLVDYYFDLLLSPEAYERTPPYILGVIINLLLKKNKKNCSAGKSSLFYTHSGDVYPCQMYYGDTSNKIGNINNIVDLKNSIDNRVQIYREDLPECRECLAYRFCNMWCPGGAYLFAGSERQVMPIRCVVQKAIGEKIICRLADVYASDNQQEFIKNIISLSSRYSVAKYLGKVV